MVRSAPFPVRALYCAASVGPVGGDPAASTLRARSAWTQFASEGCIFLPVFDLYHAPVVDGDFDRTVAEFCQRVENLLYETVRLGQG